MRRTAATITALLLATTAGCSSGSGGDPKPAATVTETATPEQTYDADKARAGCVNAIAEAIANRPAGFDPDKDDDPRPAECDAIPEVDYTDAYMEGLERVNKQGRDKFSECLEDPACTSVPVG
ncbi:hypothetical protein [Streptomyces uncialis]|uniref:hypothetical protein n=1 Tax=Streptomyces uncialis TaxID=1048205 RepID=UPI0037ADF9B7